MKASINEFRRNFILLGLASVLLPAYQSVIANELRKSDIDSEAINRAILSMLASSRAYGKKLQKIILNGLQLELWDLDSKKVYFSIPEGIDPKSNIYGAVLQKPTLRNEAKLANGNLTIDGMHITRTKEKYHLFSVNYKDIYFDPDRIISLDFGDKKYSVNLRKLALFLRNDSIYGGFFRVSKVPSGIEKPDFLNHGALVTQKGESSLTEFVEQIVIGKISREEKIQSTLDFITEKITYDQKEFYFGREFLQRFTETLIAREGDCSNKSILFASMLEQLDVEYLLVYSKNHIYVAVEKQNFSNENGYAFNYKNKTWIPAETTTRTFKIGKTVVDKPELIRGIKYIQEPRLKNEIYSFPDEALIMFG